MNNKEWEAVLNFIRTSGLSVEDVLKALQLYQKKQAEELRKQMYLPFKGAKFLR